MYLPSVSPQVISSFSNVGDINEKKKQMLNICDNYIKVNINILLDIAKESVSINKVIKKEQLKSQDRIEIEENDFLKVCKDLVKTNWFEKITRLNGKLNEIREFIREIDPKRECDLKKFPNVTDIQKVFLEFANMKIFVIDNDGERIENWKIDLEKVFILHSDKVGLPFPPRQTVYDLSEDQVFWLSDPSVLCGIYFGEDKPLLVPCLKTHRFVYESFKPSSPSNETMTDDQNDQTTLKDDSVHRDFSSIDWKFKTTNIVKQIFYSLYFLQYPQPAFNGKLKTSTFIKGIKKYFKTQEKTFEKIVDFMKCFNDLVKEEREITAKIKKELKVSAFHDPELQQWNVQQLNATTPGIKQTHKKKSTHEPEEISIVENVTEIKEALEPSSTKQIPEIVIDDSSIYETFQRIHGVGEKISLSWNDVIRCMYYLKFSIEPCGGSIFKFEHSGQFSGLVQKHSLDEWIKEIDADESIVSKTSKNIDKPHGKKSSEEKLSYGKLSRFKELLIDAGFTSDRVKFQKKEIKKEVEKGNK